MDRRNFFRGLLPMALVVADSVSVEPKKEDSPRVVGTPMCSCGFVMCMVGWFTTGEDYVCTNGQCPNFEKKFRHPRIPMERA